MSHRLLFHQRRETQTQKDTGGTRGGYRSKSELVEHLFTLKQKKETKTNTKHFHTHGTQTRTHAHTNVYTQNTGTLSHFTALLKLNI
jgi:hypothetical protein